MDEVKSDELTPKETPQEPTKIEDMSGEGVKVKLRDGKEYIIYPFLLKDIKPFLAITEEIYNAESQGQGTPIDKMIESVYLVFKQAYPQMTKEEVGGLVSIKSFKKITEIALDISGIEDLIANAKNLTRPNLKK